MTTDITPLPDAPARAFATDPRENVLLEASAGTGKTTVLVTRYLNLIAAGVDPRNVLAITFTRKAAAEMRERILGELRRAADRSPEGRERWRTLRDRLADITISTIDAFCISLLREFPLEADLDPGFSIADETEAARLGSEAVDHAIRVGRSGASASEDLALVLTTFGGTQLGKGLEHLLDRRLVAPSALAHFLRGVPGDLTGSLAAARALDDIVRTIDRRPGGLDAFIAHGPINLPGFRVLVSHLRAIRRGGGLREGQSRIVIDGLRAHFRGKSGEPRRRAPATKPDYASDAAFRRHGSEIKALAPDVGTHLDRFTRELNSVLARGLRRLFMVALDEYRRLLAERDAIDFSGALERAVALLGQMDEFAQSRYRLESRYHHVLVDEMQDTSRMQWRLIAQLVESWGEGAGLVADAPLPPSIFVVGDRKQSIYRFRDAEIAVLDEAARFIASLRPESAPRRSITRSFRALPEVLAFVNDVFDGVDKVAGRTDAFSFGADDRFPIATPPPAVDPAHILRERPLGLVVEATVEAMAEAVADEIARLLGEGTVRDRDAGAPRAVRPGDIAILFRARASHRAFEAALERRRIPSYVYKGLGFFDTDEVQDIVSLLRCLARPAVPLRVAALLRSRFVRLSDPALVALRGELATVLIARSRPAAWALLREDDQRALVRLLDSMARWLALADRVPPADLLDLAIAESAYAFELAGPGEAQARENVKKLRGLLRRLQNRGYATLDRLGEHIDRLSTGDEANAVIDAANAVNLMTVHAAKGLEFPVVFAVDLARGAGGRGAPVRVIADAGRGEPAVSIASLVSEAGEEDRAGEREETKRLLYVALTRARDCLYLAAEVRGKGPPMRPGSLGEALPGSLQALCREALASAGAAEALEWTGPSGRVHGLQHCRVAPVPLTPVPPAPPDADEPPHYARIDGTPRAIRVGAIEHILSGLGIPHGPARHVPMSDVLAGRTVHRLFRAGLPSDAPFEDVVAVARRLIAFDERAQLGDDVTWLQGVAGAFGALRAQADVRQALETADVHYEVPFSMRVEGDPPILVHGVVDALALQPDGTVVVVEFKTGRPAEWHKVQVALYEDAARRLFPGRPVTALLVYSGLSG